MKYNLLYSHLNSILTDSITFFKIYDNKIIQLQPNQNQEEQRKSFQNSIFIDTFILTFNHLNNLLKKQIID